jgi:tol-pal system protein YbgF
MRSRCLVCLLLLALAAPAWSANKDIERLYLQIATLQRDLNEARRIVEESQREIKRLNESLAEQNTSVRKSLQDQRLQADAVLEALRDLKETVGTVRERVEPGSITPASAIPSTSGAPTPSETADAAAPAPRELFSQAYADFRRGNYDLAIQAFREFLRRNATSELADNAQYWIGECHLGKKEYSDAVAAFDELLRQYPATERIPEAHYKKAVALERLGRRSQALIEYRFVFERFPNTEAGRLARTKVQPQ